MLCAIRGPTGGQREAVYENQKRLLKVKQRYIGRKRQDKGRGNNIYHYFLFIFLGITFIKVDSLMDKLTYSSHLY